MPMPINPIPPAFSNVAHGIGPSAKVNVAGPGKNTTSIKYRSLDHVDSCGKAGMLSKFYRSGLKSMFYLPLPFDRRESRKPSKSTGDVSRSRSLSPFSKAIYQAGIANLPGAKRSVVMAKSTSLELAGKMGKDDARDQAIKNHDPVLSPQGGAGDKTIGKSGMALSKERACERLFGECYKHSFVSFINASGHQRISPAIKREAHKHADRDAKKSLMHFDEDTRKYAEYLSKSVLRFDESGRRESVIRPDNQTSWLVRTVLNPRALARSADTGIQG